MDDITAKTRSLYIWFDVDGVLGDFHGHFEKFAREQIPNIELDYLVYSFGMDRDTFISMHDEMVTTGWFKSMPVIEGAPELLNKLAAAGHKIRYMTARVSLKSDPEIQKEIEKATIEWLTEKGFPNPTEVFFTNSVFKSKLLVEHDTDILVEDHLETCQDTSKMKDRRGIPIQAVLVDKRWNRHGEHEPRINTLSELENLWIQEFPT